MKGERTEDIIDSIEFYSPTGQFMFYANYSRAAWYYRKGLSEKISDSPLSFRLKFWPKGPGKQNKALAKSNQCVICGTKDITYLTKHHIVPKVYRQYMPKRFKSNNDYDVQVVCRPCHDQYETHAIVLKEALSRPFNLDFDLYQHAKRITKAAKILTTQNNLPFERIQELEAIVKEAGIDLDMELLERVGRIKLAWDPYQARKVVNYWSHDLREFIFIWRKHFIEYAKPKFLPAGWTWNSDSIEVQPRIPKSRLLPKTNK